MAKFNVGNKVFFLADGRNIKSGKTDIRFCFVSNGVVVSYNDDKYTINEGMELQTLSANSVFATFEEATVRAKELNNENLSELEALVGLVKDYYSL